MERDNINRNMPEDSGQEKAEGTRGGTPRRRGSVAGDLKSATSEVLGKVGSALGVETGGQKQTMREGMGQGLEYLKNMNEALTALTRRGRDEEGAVPSESTHFRELIRDSFRILDKTEKSEQELSLLEENKAEIANLLSVKFDAESFKAMENVQKDERISSLNNLAGLIEEQEGILTKEDDQRIFREIIPNELKEDFLKEKKKMDAYFNSQLEELGEEGRAYLLGDIKEAAAGFYRGMSIQRYSKEHMLEQLEIEKRKGALKERAGNEGLRTWYMYKQLEYLMEGAEFLRKTSVTADPYENIKSIHAAMNFFETVGTTEAFGAARNRLSQLLESIQASNITNKEKEAMQEQVQAWNRFTPLLILQDEEKGLPEKMKGAAGNLQAESLYHYYGRVSEARDMHGKLYLVDSEGRELFADARNRIYYYDSEKKAYFYKVKVDKDIEGREEQVIEEGGRMLRINEKNEREEVLLVSLNLLSEFENAFIEEYEDDRRRVNNVQRATKNDLDWQSKDADVQWLISYNLEVNKPSSKYYKYYNSENGMFDWAALKRDDEPGFNKLQEELGKVNEWWGNDNEINVDQRQASKTYLALMFWYRTMTYTGADGVYGSFEWETGEDDINKTRRGIKEARIIEKRLVKRLEDKGVNSGRLDDLLGKTDGKNVRSGGNFELVKAMMWSGSNLARLKMADGMDRFRYYNRQGEQVYTIFGESTPYHLRNTSHPLDYFMNEHHGNRRTNLAVRKVMEEESGGASYEPGGAKHESGGFMNANLQANVKMFKMVRYDMAPEIWDAIDYNVTQELVRIKSNNRDDVLDYVIANAFYEKTINYKDKDGNSKTAEMSLSNVNWALTSKRLIGREIEDFYNDKTDALNMYERLYKNFSLQPFRGNLHAMLEHNWSRRDIRRHRNVELWGRVYWMIGHEWKDEFDQQENITNGEMESEIAYLKAKKFISLEKAKRMENELLGTKLPRTVAQVADSVWYGLGLMFDPRKPGYGLGRLMDLFKTLMSYLMSSR